MLFLPIEKHGVHRIKTENLFYLLQHRRYAIARTFLSLTSSRETFPEK